MSDGVRIRRIGATDEDARAAYVAIRNVTTPDSPDSLDTLRWADSTYPGGVLLLAEEPTPAGGVRAIGAATAGRIYMRGPEFERWWLGIWVLDDARGRGVGGTLLQAASEVARAAGKTGFETQLSAQHAAGRRFLEARGFVETDRAKAVRLELAGQTPAVPDPPAGIDLTTLAERPDLLDGVFRVAVETFPDVPSGGEQLYVGSFEEFVARDVDHSAAPRDAFVIAVERASGAVVGYGNLTLQASNPRIALHDMTAVRRAWRGRGIATAIKRATIAWAIANGIEALETGNDETNVAMRAVNARLGYQPLPDVVGYQGPLAPER